LASFVLVKWLMVIDYLLLTIDESGAPQQKGQAAGREERATLWLPPSHKAVADKYRRAIRNACLTSPAGGLSFAPKYVGIITYFQAKVK